MTMPIECQKARREIGKDLERGRERPDTKEAEGRCLHNLKGQEEVRQFKFHQTLRTH